MIWRSRSIQTEVPVYPRCPIENDENRVPEEEPAVGVSHPRVQGDPSWRVRKRSSQPRGKRSPSPNHGFESSQTALAVPNKPACPETPPRSRACSSWTMPASGALPSSGASVAAKDRFSSGDPGATGVNPASEMPRGIRIYSSNRQSRGFDRQTPGSIPPGCTRSRCIPTGFPEQRRAGGPESLFSDIPVRIPEHTSGRGGPIPRARSNGRGDGGRRLPPAPSSGCREGIRTTGHRCRAFPCWREEGTGRLSRGAW